MVVSRLFQLIIVVSAHEFFFKYSKPLCRKSAWFQALTMIYAILDVSMSFLRWIKAVYFINKKPVFSGLTFKTCFRYMEIFHYIIPLQFWALLWFT